MSFGSDHSLYPSPWAFTTQDDVSDDSALYFHVVDAGGVDAHNVHGFSHHALDTSAHSHPVWHASPTASPTGSDYTTSSVPDDFSTVYSAPPFDIQSPFPSPVDRASRSNSYPPVRSHPRPPRPRIPEPEPPLTHQTFEVETGEEEVVRAVIHRLSEEERRGLNVAPANRPTFCCLYQDCGRFLVHRAQVKPHLADHGYRFRKPFRCSCGAEFGRQVEAARHVEDKKPCEQCRRSGRKYKGGAICLRCLRNQVGN